MATDNKPTPTLPADVAAKYTLKTIAPGAYHFPGYGTINLTKITIGKADQLFALGFPYLVPVPPPAAAPAVKTAQGS